MELVCQQCGAVYSVAQPRWRCDCGEPVDIRFTPHFDRACISGKPQSLWRYCDALPLENDSLSLPNLNEGMTPLEAIAGPWGETGNYFKFDFMMPTGSYKDRGAAVMMRQLSAWGLKEIIEDSSGNAGASVAAFCALAGVRARIFIPAAASAGKAAQIAMYGAELVRVPGSREQTTKAAEAAAHHSFYASHNWSPWFMHGVKTLAFEIWEQLGWNAPDAVIAPVGNGSLVLGLYQGFLELSQAGECAAIPRIYGVQASACAPLAEAYEAGENEPRSVVKRETMAEGIASAYPVRGREILAAVRSSGGAILSVGEDEIWQGVLHMAQRGVYIEPTSGTAPAALLKLRQQGLIGPNELAVVELTGSGLKATDKIVGLREQYGGGGAF